MLPVVLVLVFGSIEVANGVFLKQSLTVAAYEGARAATRAGGTTAQAQERIREVLVNRGIENETITITPAVNADTARGTTVRVTVAAPGSGVALNPLQLFQNRNVQQSVVMVRL